MNMSLSKLWELVMDRELWRAAPHDMEELGMTERLNWTDVQRAIREQTEVFGKVEGTIPG